MAISLKYILTCAAWNRKCQQDEVVSFRFAAYGSYVNTYAPAGLRVSGWFVSSGSTKMSQERWFQTWFSFTSNWGRWHISWAYLDIWHIFQCWNHQTVRSLKHQKVHLARDESRQSTSGPFCSRTRQSFVALERKSSDRKDEISIGKNFASLDRWRVFSMLESVKIMRNLCTLINHSMIIPIHQFTSFLKCFCPQ